ncbi:uncharacterized protein [Montipora capricornis]|uniref:uncharacterized protein isoform X1 n=2 Tax=Montipora capricornis TaxID=246305 RepID=UPI0035F14C5C
MVALPTKENKMVLKTFLCCFTVKEGSWICGVVSLFLGGLRLYLQWFNLDFRQRMTEGATKQLKISFETIQVINILQLFAAAISMEVSLLMFLGLYKRWRWLLCPWMLWAGLEELFSIAVIIFYACVRVKLNWSVDISNAVMLLVSIYLVLCVYSYFIQMRDAEFYAMIRGMPTMVEDEFEDDSPGHFQVNRPV